MLICNYFIYAHEKIIAVYTLPDGEHGHLGRIILQDPAEKSATPRKKNTEIIEIVK